MMTTTQQNLWNRISAFSLDAVDAAYPFSKRLARENAWSLSYAKRVIEEYKRFMFLAVSAGHEVTPSEEVDEVWHLHLIYTKSYWDDFCNGVLGKPIHHNPTKGGKSEREKYGALYNRTLDSYRAFFNEEPPADIWQSEQVRFKKAAELKKINTRENWVIPKPKFLGASAAVVFAPIAILVLPGCGGGELLFGGLAAAGGAGAFALANRAREDRKKQEGDGLGSSDISVFDGSDDGGDSDEKSGGGFFDNLFGGGGDSSSSSDSGGGDSGGGDSGGGCGSGCGGGCGGGD